ncbi:MAG TPA: tRNA preQ1(34) S-adenosylmethionine ribosyltransferase-isomerase QueA [Anaerolineae bacterium]|nr:tRNA preQ1(34) S-adenosylmethionine ribosyltransferase-isomerase QueA [Anaerolineae bacterium]HQH38416.1 tRNA preQ1(34) S-adenosylmethionine ribosyltransferase-isomerase QueA [Anaerolineae bacterium]
MKTTDLDYTLPEELIAQTPVEPRDSSRLLVLHRDTGRLEHRIFRDIGDYLRPGDLLVANESRVIPARLFGHKEPGGGKVEVLLLHQVEGTRWRCLVGGARTRVGTRVRFDHAGAPSPLTADVMEMGERGERELDFSAPVEAYFDVLGVVPLPPYIHEPLRDPERYQTVYAHTSGSAAAPTAGLHFTPELLLALRDRGVEFAFVTLHVGLDTFRPITEEVLEEHQIHTEWGSLSLPVAEQINRAKVRGGRVIAVGTTSVRVLETAARHGLLQTSDDDAGVTTCPWRPLAPFEGFTDLYITPGFRFRIVDALITNFHLPKSTLLALVMAFAGEDNIRRAYAEAIARRYRFFSFGDAMLIV